MLDQELRALLVCPVDHAVLLDGQDALVCSACGRRYPIRDGVPVMLPEESTTGDTPEVAPPA